MQVCIIKQNNCICFTNSTSHYQVHSKVGIKVSLGKITYSTESFNALCFSTNYINKHLCSKTHIGFNYNSKKSSISSNQIKTDMLQIAFFNCKSTRSKWVWLFHWVFGFLAFDFVFIFLHFYKTSAGFCFQKS